MRIAAESEHAAEILQDREEHLRAVLEAVPECVTTLDREGRLLEMNEPGLRLVGASCFEEIEGKLWMETVVPADQAAYGEMIEAVFRGESRRLEFRMTTPTAAIRYLETRSVPIWVSSEHKEVRALLGVTRDLTERIRAEEERRKMESQVRQSQRLAAMGTLAGGIAHDFNNLLASILGNADLIELDLEPSHRAMASVRHITRAGLRAKELIQQILTFSRRTDTVRAPLHLPSVLKETVKLLRASIPAMVDIRCELAPDCPMVLADATQVHQILVNLVTNAWHALPEAGGRIAVSLAACEVDAALAASQAGWSPGPYVRLSVADNGHGMDRHTVERVFEPFFTTTPTGKGVGMGLSVVHGILKAHHGTVLMHSAPGQGTTCDVYFPAQTASPSRVDGLEIPIVRGNGQHLLLVDDEEMVGFVVKRLLDQIGYRVTRHTRPSHALAAFRQDPSSFDLVITDHCMPEMSGTTLAVEILRLRPGIPVVLVSGLGDAELADKALQIGVREVLTKPVDPIELGRSINRCMAGTAAASIGSKG